jgi:hypothetical protein|eukprot:COSAG01_NODE_604_length_14894_cov_24.503211_9_plen_79_part_00
MLAGAGRSQETRGRREGTRPPAGSWLAGLGPSGRQSQPVVCCLSLSAVSHTVSVSWLLSCLHLPAWAGPAWLRSAVRA